MLLHVTVVNKRMRSRKISLLCISAACNMWVLNQNREHAKRFIVLDKTHPAILAGDCRCRWRPGRLSTVFLEIQIERKILNVVETPVPLIKRLMFYRPDPLVASRAEIRD